MNGEMQQLDLFDDYVADAQPALNGMYYESATELFVSFVLGRRHWEGHAAHDWPKAWQDKMKQERAI